MALSEKLVTRRQLATAGVACVAAAAIPACAYASEEGEQGAQWDEEADLVVIGAGSGLLAAMAAQYAGKTCIVLEKTGSYGGSSFISGGGIWVPNSDLRTEEELEQDKPELLKTYIKASDYRATGSLGDEVIDNYIANAPNSYAFIRDELGLPLVNRAGYSDYFTYEGAGAHRTVEISSWQDMRDAVDAHELDIRYETAAVELLTNAEGAVEGVLAETTDGSELRFKAGAVLVAAGSFDHNPDMCKAFLRIPLDGTWTTAGNTGDGIRMCMKLDADLCNMSDVIGDTVILPSRDFSDFTTDYSMCDQALYRTLPHTLMVNSLGRRFVSESDVYATVGVAMGNTNLVAGKATTNAHPTLVFDAQHVEHYGFPRGDEDGSMPSWVRAYDSLEELAEGEGINAEALIEEVERFNGFCADGVDRDWHRGEGGWDGPLDTCVNSIANRERVLAAEGEIPNLTMGTVEKAPFYALTYGLSSFGTSGGMKVNVRNQVTRQGEPIPNLYACGTSAAHCYASGGWALGWSFFGAINAANDIFGMGLFE